MKRSGFTLAEVLIVLVILGIIASMTVPSLMQNANQTVFVTGVGKAYSTLNNAIQLASVQNGVVPGDATLTGSAATYISNLFRPVMKVSKYNAGESCFTTQDGMVYCIGNVVNGANCSFMPNNTAANTEPANSCAQITVDVNGLTKGPNRNTESNNKQLINDRFHFYVFKDGVVGAQSTRAILSGNICDTNNVAANTRCTTIAAIFTSLIGANVKQ